MLPGRLATYSALSFAVTTALVVGVLQPISAEAAESEDAPSGDVLALPAEVADAAEAEIPSVVDGDFDVPAAATMPLEVDAELSALDVSKKVPTSVDDLPGEDALISRHQFQQAYDVGDGLTLTEISDVPLNVVVDGDWVPIETDVAGSGFWSFLGIGGGEVTRHPLKPRFAETASDKGALRLSKGRYDVAFTLMDAADSKLLRDLVPWSEDKNRVEYGNVFPDTDLLYDVDNAGVKEMLRLREAPDPETRTSWRWQIDAPGLGLVEGADGAIEFLNAAGRPEFVIPAPQMWDSAGETGKRANSTASVDVAISRVGGRWTLTLDADRSWLTSKERVYPVFVDPTAEVAVTDSHSYKSNGQYNRNWGIQIGNTNWNGIWRTLAQYPLSQFWGRQVLDANIGVAVASSDSTTTERWGTVHVATDFHYHAVGQHVGNIRVGAVTGEINDDRLTAKIAEWVRARLTGPYLMFRGDESNAFTYKHLDSRLFVLSKGLPSPGTLASPAPPHNQTGSITPLLKVSGASDPGGQGSRSGSTCSRVPLPCGRHCGRHRRKYGFRLGSCSRARPTRGVPRSKTVTTACSGRRRWCRHRRGNLPRSTLASPIRAPLHPSMSRSWRRQSRHYPWQRQPAPRSTDSRSLRESMESQARWPIPGGSPRHPGTSLKQSCRMADHTHGR